MLNSIADCDKALKDIDTRIKFFEMERDHILEIRTFLKEHKDLSSLSMTESNREKILRIVRNNPGINGTKIKNVLAAEGYVFVGRQVQSLVSNLAKVGEIENRGSHGLGAQWFIKEETDATE
jgi:hypothetical protein